MNGDELKAYLTKRGVNVLNIAFGYLVYIDGDKDKAYETLKDIQEPTPIHFETQKVDATQDLYQKYFELYGLTSSLKAKVFDMEVKVHSLTLFRILAEGVNGIVHFIIKIINYFKSFWDKNGNK